MRVINYQKRMQFKFFMILPNFHNEKYLIKDKNGKVLKKSEDLNQLINKTSWNNLRLVK